MSSKAAEQAAGRSRGGRRCGERNSVSRRLVVAAREPVFRSGLTAVLESSTTDVEAVGTVMDARVAIAELVPASAILVLDPPLPDAPADAACADLIARNPGTAGVVLLRRSDPLSLRAACRHGARGIFATSVSGDQLAAALERIERGEVVVHPSLLADVLRLQSAHGAGVRAGLTRNQLTVLRLVADGRTSKEIAQALRTTASGVDHAIERAAQHLGATHRAHAVAQAIRLGLLR
jgi:two-component system nitrate/nitrite response regulator NarL